MPRTPHAKKTIPLPEPADIDEDTELEQRREARRQARETSAAHALMEAIEKISLTYNVTIVAVPQISDGIIVATIRVFAK